MRRILLLLVPLLLAACQPEPVAPGEVPTLDIMDGPAQSGVVYRGVAGGFWLRFDDAATGWQVTMGLDVAAACTGGATTDPLYWADKIVPVEYWRDISLNRFDPATTAVWPFHGLDCDRYTTVTPVASGFSTVTWFDNDWTGSANNNTNTWGWSAHGTLTWADGTPAHFSFHRRLVWDKVNEPKLVSQKLTLR